MLPSDDAAVIRELAAGEPFAMLDDSLGWAWGYAGEERRVGYLRTSRTRRLLKYRAQPDELVQAVATIMPIIPPIAQSRAGHFGRRAGNSSQPASGKGPGPDRALAHEPATTCTHMLRPFGGDFAVRAHHQRGGPGDHGGEQQ